MLDNKISTMLQLIEILFDEYQTKWLSSSDKVLPNRLEISQKTFQRYLSDIKNEFGFLITFDEEKQGKKSFYKVATVSDLIEKMLEAKKINLPEIISKIDSSTPEISKNLSFKDIKNIEKAQKKDSDIFLFNSKIFAEAIDDKVTKLKNNIKEHLWTILRYKYRNKEELIEIKPMKIVFSEDNWYLIAFTEEDKIRFFRIAFIDNIIPSDKNSFHFKELNEKLDEFIKYKFQNSMTIDEDIKVATLKVSPRIAIYFQKTSKKYLKSQEFKEKLDDGSVIFTLNYTQPIEVLPFIKRWLPDIEILEGNDLKSQLKDDLTKALELIK
jgi:predicted DNA-binding transcriptional regulator YafY